MRDELSQLLQALEGELQAQGRWDSEPPPQAALRSTQPFSVDTLRFDQWLQWVLLPRLQDLLLRQLPLPNNCAIQPMAEEVYGDQDPEGKRIVMIVAGIDILLASDPDALN